MHKIMLQCLSSMAQVTVAHFADRMEAKLAKASSRFCLTSFTTMYMASTKATLKTVGEFGSRHTLKMWLFRWLHLNWATRQFIIRSLSVKVGMLAWRLEELWRKGLVGEKRRFCVEGRGGEGRGGEGRGGEGRGGERRGAK